MLGHEKYFYDGKLLLKRWNFRFKDRLAFECDGCKVEIDVSISRNEWSTRAFIDGVLAVDELFPAYRAKIEQAKSRRESRAFWVLKNLSLWLVLAAVILAIFRSFE